MLYRAKQFFKGVTAYKIDSSLADIYLNSEELALFLKLPRHEKRHAIDTARTIIKMNVKENKGILIKAALLHDIGKTEPASGIIMKSILVLIDKIFPRICFRLSKRFRVFNTYYNHPQIGACLLEKTNTENKVKLLVRYHHSEKNADIEGMDILKKADNLN